MEDLKKFIKEKLNGILSLETTKDILVVEMNNPNDYLEQIQILGFELSQYSAILAVGNREACLYSRDANVAEKLAEDFGGSVVYLIGAFWLAGEEKEDDPRVLVPSVISLKSAVSAAL